MRHLLPAIFALSAILPAAAAATAEQAEFFEKKVRPLLVEKCQMCHNEQVKTSELDMSSAEAFFKGGASGPLVSANDPSSSLLLNVITYKGGLKMPPMGKMKDDEIAALTAWVESGAHWPGFDAGQSAWPVDPSGGFTEEQKAFWAFQPVADPEPPAVENASWVKSPVDRFVLAKLEAEGMSPAPPASKTALLRRATFDLIGLPPSEQEIEDFLADDSPNAFEKAVDRLLASPRYGERWGRHWLDVARYADSTGNDEDHRYPYAWRYRDYVIDAFNNDMPYDRFVREQIAGDLMPAEDGSAVNERGIVATGLLALGPKAIAQQDKMVMLYDVYDEQIDVVSKAFLGVSLACARCHDHKFDPLLQRDYYSMVNFFANTRSFRDPETHVSKLLFVPLVEGGEWDRYEEEQEAIRRKNFELSNVPEAEIEGYVQQFSGDVAGYMLAARRVYEDGESLGAAAKAANLDQEMLERWTAYLAPSGTVRNHLAEWDGAAPAEREAAARKYAESFNEALEGWLKKIDRWRKQVNRPAEEITMGIPPKPRFQAGENRFFHEAYFAKGGPFAFKGEEQNRILKPETLELIARLEKEVAELEANAMPEPARACAVQDKSPGEIQTQRLLIRGDYRSKGEETPPMFPAILEGLDQDPIEIQGSGRLELANWLAKPDHPLAGRVMANRVWHWHMGEGIVRTPSDFGKMGERPTHPELLDWLTSRFIDSGWSIKALHKTIMLSSTYQMSTDAGESVIMKDPENRLISRFNRRRLTVEEVRDGLLAVDRSIDFTMGGTIQTGFGTDGENSNDRLSINPDEHQIRTVYLPLRRANLPALLNLFDFGDAVTTMGKRPMTNVAPQALFMMNSQFVASRARTLAETLLEEDDAAARVRRAYLRTLNRNPDPAEIDQGLSYVAGVRTKFEEAGELDAWQSYCRILMASNEFIYLD